MQKLERGSQIRAYLNLHTNASVLVSSLEQKQREAHDLHAQDLTLLTVYAQSWRETGKSGIRPETHENTQKKKTITKIGNSAFEDFINSGFESWTHKSDIGAVLLGNVAQAIYSMKDTGEFSLYHFTNGFNEDIYGTEMPKLQFVHPAYPVRRLTLEQQEKINASFGKDPTGADAIGNSDLWPEELKVILKSSGLDDAKSGMLMELPIYKRFAGKLLAANPRAGEPYSEHPEAKLTSGVSRDITFTIESHPERKLTPGVAADILSALGDF